MSSISSLTLAEKILNENSSLKNQLIPSISKMNEALMSIQVFFFPSMSLWSNKIILIFFRHFQLLIHQEFFKNFILNFELSFWIYQKIFLVF